MNEQPGTVRGTSELRNLADERYAFVRMGLSRARGVVAAGLLVVLLQAAEVAAHPGSGIVQDSRGNVFFTDLARVWKIAPDGRMSVAVPDVHTHELAIDAKDNLYGEHLWFENATGKWWHRVWTMNTAGAVRDIIPTREGFLAGYSFVRDRAGVMYWAEGSGPIAIKKRDGAIATHATGDFASVQRMVAAPDGTLYLIDAGNLRRVATDGRVTTLVTRLTGLASPPPAVSRPNYHMGLWLDAAGQVYVAVGAEHLVLRSDIMGKVHVAARSAAPWAPSGGLWDTAGQLGILEYDTSNAVRVRRIDRSGRERIFTPEKR